MMLLWLKTSVKNLVQVEGANRYTSAEYKVYTYRMAVPAAAPMTFRVNI